MQLSSAAYFNLVWDINQTSDPQQKRKLRKRLLSVSPELAEGFLRQLILQLKEMIMAKTTTTTKTSAPMKKVGPTITGKKVARREEPMDEDDIVDGDEDGEDEAPAPKKKATNGKPVAKKAAKREEPEDDAGDDDEDGEDEAPAPKKKVKTVTKARREEPEDDDGDDGDDNGEEEEEEAPKKKAKRQAPTIDRYQTEEENVTTLKKVKALKLKLCPELKEAFEEFGDIPEFCKIARFRPEFQKGPVGLYRWRLAKKEAEAKAARKAKGGKR
jgi:hypothetical protein